MFYDVLSALKLQLEADELLQGFCTSNFKRPACVQAFLTKRETLSRAKLPIIMLTAPNIEMKPLGTTDKGIVRSVVKEPLVSIYAGIYTEKDAESAELMDSFLEQIDTAIMRRQTLGGVIRSMYATNAATDEGMYAPVYLSVVDYKVIK